MEGPSAERLKSVKPVGTDSNGRDTESLSFVLNSVVVRITTRYFVDMAQLLLDHFEAERRRAQAVLEPGKVGAPALSRGEIS